MGILALVVEEEGDLMVHRRRWEEVVWEGVTEGIKVAFSNNREIRIGEDRIRIKAVVDGTTTITTIRTTSKDILIHSINREIVVVVVEGGKETSRVGIMGIMDRRRLRFVVDPPEGEVVDSPIGEIDLHPVEG